MAANAATAKPASPHDLEAFCSVPHSIPAQPADSASLPGGALRRQVLKVRAVCAKVRSYGSVRGVESNPHPYRNKDKSKTSCKGTTKARRKSKENLRRKTPFSRLVIRR